MKKHLKNRGFKLLDKNRKENKTYSTILAKENEFKNKLNEMGQFYGKEISDLKKKLADANVCIENYKENKAYLQENLKRALMRGVVAMNLEAMNILEPDADKSNLVNMTNNIVDFNYFNNNNNKITFTDPLPINSNLTNIQNLNNNMENIQLNSIPSNISNTNMSNQNTNNRNIYEKQEYNFINNDFSNINNSNFNQNTHQNIQPEFLEKKVKRKIS
jgi:hypothetical protein